MFKHLEVLTTSSSAPPKNPVYGSELTSPRLLTSSLSSRFESRNFRLLDRVTRRGSSYQRQLPCYLEKYFESTLSRSDLNSLFVPRFVGFIVTINNLIYFIEMVYLCVCWAVIGIVFYNPNDTVIT
mgnify:CR=1